MVRRELRSPSERVTVRVDQGPTESAGQRGFVEPQGLEEVGEAGRGRHLAVIDRPKPLGLPPARAQGLVAPLDPDLGHLSLQDGVQEPGRGAHRLAVDLDLRHALTVEADEGVEEIEQDGGVPHQSGFLPA